MFQPQQDEFLFVPRGPARVFALVVHATAGCVVTGQSRGGQGTTSYTQGIKRWVIESVFMIPRKEDRSKTDVWGVQYQVRVKSLHVCVGSML